MQKGTEKKRCYTLNFLHIIILSLQVDDSRKFSTSNVKNKNRKVKARISQKSSFVKLRCSVKRRFVTLITSHGRRVLDRQQKERSNHFFGHIYRLSKQIQACSTRRSSFHVKDHWGRSGLRHTLRKSCRKPRSSLQTLPTLYKLSSIPLPLWL